MRARRDGERLGKTIVKTASLLPFRPTAASAVRVLPSRRAGTPESFSKEAYDPHQGSQARHHRQAPPARLRHGVAAGADRAAHAARQRAHRASPHPREGPLLAPRPAQARGPAPPAPQLPPARGPRGLPRADQGARPQALGTTPRGGWAFVRAPRSGGADPNLHLPPKKDGGQNRWQLPLSSGPRASRRRSATRRSASRRASSPSR